MRLFKTLLAALLVSTFLLQGCGGNEPAPDLQPQVDPRFVSAESVLEQFKDAMFRAPLDVRRVWDMTYTENDLQRDLLQISRSMVSILDLQVAIGHRFGTDIHHSPFAEVLASTRMVENSGQRAVAHYTLDPGKNHEVHFVKIGDRWWISGYTLEYSPETKRLLAIDREMLEALSTLIDAVVPPLIAKIKNGEFNSQEQAESAMQMAFASHAMQNPQRYERLGRYIVANEDLFEALLPK